MFLNWFRVAARWKVCDLWVFPLPRLSLRSGLGGWSQLPEAHGTVDPTEMQFSKMAGQSGGSLKVNVLHAWDREGGRDSQRMRSGDSLSPLREEVWFNVCLWAKRLIKAEWTLKLWSSGDYSNNFSIPLNCSNYYHLHSTFSAELSFELPSVAGESWHMCL